MGSINSVPVVSQVKSLVQVIQGNEEGAKKTQEEFIRTAPVAAQINSLVHHIQVNFYLTFFLDIRLNLCSLILGSLEFRLGQD